jgi:hypothetical protein
MTLSVIPFLVTVAGSAAAPVVAAARAWRRRIGLVRIADGRCSLCGKAWRVGEVDAFLVEGQLVCSDCAPRVRRRTVAASATVLVASGIAFYFGWGPIAETVARYGLLDGLMSLSRWAWLMFALPPVVIVASADWAIRSMKSDNARALESLARIRLLTAPLAKQPAPLRGDSHTQRGDEPSGTQP